MIKLSRPRTPDYLKKDEVLENTKKANRLFNATALKDVSLNEERKKFEYKYNDSDEVKDLLKKMCYNKCAYCESTFLHVYYGDIEHFRPKKFVGTRSDQVKPGYYWLGNIWSNLFISCLFCNRAIKHVVNTQQKPITIGKQNQFPLNDQKLYRKTRDHISWENDGKKKEDSTRLIINPCEDKPEEYFRYDDNGFVLPKSSNPNTMKYKRAAASIDVYALKRLYLVQERRKRLVELKMQFTLIRKILLSSLSPNPANNAINTLPGEVALIKNNSFSQLSKEIETLFHFTYKRQLYSGMCRQYVYEFIRVKLFDTHTADKALDRKIKKIETSVHKQLDEKYKLSGEL